MTTVHSEDRDGGVRILTLDRPPANAITPGLLADLSEALSAARDAASVRAVVLTGAGRFFSAGLDLRGGIDFSALTSSERSTDPFLALKTCLLDLLRFPKPMLAMLRGHAIAGGMILLLACDYRLGLASDYRLGLNEVAIGASFPKAAFEVVRLRLTHQQANEVLLGAALYSADEAVRLGVVEELLPENSFEETVFTRAARLGPFPQAAYAHTKLALTQDAVARIESETPEAAMEGATVWMDHESVKARAEQARKLAGG